MPTVKISVDEDYPVAKIIPKEDYPELGEYLVHYPDIEIPADKLSWIETVTREYKKVQEYLCDLVYTKEREENSHDNS